MRFLISISLSLIISNTNLLASEKLFAVNKFLKESKGLIRRQELAKMLNVSNDYLRSISKSQSSS